MSNRALRLAGPPGPEARVTVTAQSVSVRTGTVRILHHAAAPLHFDYRGAEPLLLFTHREPGLGRAGRFDLLAPGEPASIHVDAPIEVLAVAYGGPRALAAAHGVGLRDRGVQALAHELRRVLRDERGGEAAYVEALAEGLFVRAAAVAARAPGGSSAVQALAPGKTRRVTDFIEAHLDQPLSVAELAELVGMSRGHFSRAFAAAIGETPRRFVLQRRLEAARQRLERPDEDLATIALRSGFSSHAHLSSAFRAVFGMTPSAYRRSQRTAPIEGR